MSEPEQLELNEIQGLVLSGYAERPCAKYVVFAIDDAGRARSWLRRLVDRLQYGEYIATTRREPPFLNEVCLNLALTYAGLARLGLPYEALLGFSGSFRGGMAAPHRARQLGDDGASAPERWRWGGPACDEVHGVLLVYAGSDDGDPGEDERCASEAAREVCAEHGLRQLSVRDTLPIQQKNRAEHFGFADGISNPNLAGLSRSKNPDVIPNGEILLGYRNAYGKYGMSPLLCEDDPGGALLPASRVKPRRRDFGRNGSYLIFRELSQDVGRFWQFMEQASEALPERPGPIWVASRFVGRWPNGAPVTRYPTIDDPHRESSENDFGYHDHADFFGTACPVGSHIRRTNPRETLLPVPHDPPLASDVADRALARQRAAIKDRHRLLRRGRIYGPRCAERFDLEALKGADTRDRGLHFLCFVANIRRQFEFVQGTWVVNPNFAGLSRDPDPLLGARRSYPFEASSFALPGCPARFVDGVPRFVETRGGAYLFMPSRSALRYLAAIGREVELTPSPQPTASAVDRELEQLEREKVERDLQAQPEPRRAKRAFHPRCHGIVRALLEVDEDLPSPFHAGVFVPGARYPAWVRVSSGSFEARSDERRNLHGLAIKLMNVPRSARASEFEANTQDFLLVDAPRLMFEGAREALELERAARNWRSFALYVARHPRVLVALRSITSAPAHPLERTYNSITPFAYGEGRAVRWVVRLARGEVLTPAPPGPDRLRHALRAQLARGPVRLEFCVQNRGSRPLPLEDARVDWRVPEERVAALTLLPDGFDTPLQEELGEALSFNPWHGLRDHLPLGALNRTRWLYRGLYELRMRLRGKLPFEPTHDPQAE